MTTKPLAVILGGGISGLSSAYYLARSQAHRFEKILVLEGSNRVGGWVNTTVTDNGGIFEHGPRSLRTAGVVGKNSLQLVTELGLATEVVPVERHHPAANKRFIYANKTMHQYPSSLKSLFRTQPPFTKPFISYLLKEPFIKNNIDEDESLYDFIQKRLGNEMADYVIDPLCIGIFAGDARQLSARSCIPAIFNPARQHGSIVKGLFASGKERVSEASSPLVLKAKKERWPVWTLRPGLQTLTDRLADILTDEYGVEIIKQSPCRTLEFTERNTIKVITDTASYTADNVISAIPAHVLSSILPSSHNTLSQYLEEIEQVSVAVINLEYEGHVLPGEGFGYLIPSSEKSKLLGVIYDSCTFPQHNRKGSPTTRLTCMMGGHWFHDHFGDPESVNPKDLLSIAMATLKDHINVSAEPLRSIVNINKNAITQYRVGHFKLIDKIDAYLEGLPLHVTGASYKGVSVNDCIYNAKIIADSVATTS